VYDIFILFFSFAILRRIGVSHHPSMSNSTNTNTNTNNTTMTAGTMTAGLSGAVPRAIWYPLEQIIVANETANMEEEEGLPSPTTTARED